MAWAHLEKQPGYSWCGVTLEAREFSFKDLEHTLRHYNGRDPKLPRVCQSCVKDIICQSGLSPEEYFKRLR